jgi:hypothetical protein
MTSLPETSLHTHRVNAEQALDTLDYQEMEALAAMFERWALTDDSIDPEERTRLIQLSSDYEHIADFAGPQWTARKPGAHTDAIQFVAREELENRRKEAAMAKTELGAATPSKRCAREEAVLVRRFRKHQVSAGCSVRGI